jgi:GntR family transcriptional repressor for pyruvate dehydrogenase complex
MFTLDDLPCPIAFRHTDRELVIPLTTGKLLATFKQLISEGDLQPGAKLPSERDFARSLGVARSSLRQALKVLEIMGVISQRVGDGTYLNKGAASILGEPMEFLILLDGITFHELMEARLIVEPELAARAAERATEEDLSALRREMAAMETAADNGQFVEHDLAFHRAIFQAAGNRVCNLMFSVVHLSLRTLVEHTSQRVPAAHTLRLHQRIYAAIRKRDVDAARRRMAEHLVDARNLLAMAAERQAQNRLKQRIGALSGKKRRTA